MNISSVLLHVVPEHLDTASRELAAMPGVEIHAVSAEGKVVVTVEHQDIDATESTYVALHNIVGVASVAMVYQYDDSHSQQKEILA